MSKSAITKKALAQALKELLSVKPLDKISVSDICEQCGMNRKSFYYHFRDKYDLVNWIYYTEFITVINAKDYDIIWERLEDLCGYLYDNRSFYRKTFYLADQNSFTEYFSEFISSILSEDIQKFRAGEPDRDSFYVDFYTDAFVAATRKWIMSPDPMPADVFVHLLKSTLIRTSSILMEQVIDKKE